MSNDQYGIRISQGGVAVDKAADYQMVLDDRWPMVEFAFCEVVDLKSAASASSGIVDFIKIFTHNLGFIPGFTFMSITLTGFSISGQAINDFIVADDKYIYLKVTKTSGTVVTVDFKFFIAILAENCNKTFAADIAAITAQQSSGPSDYGIKVIRQTTSRGIDEISKGGYSLNTNAKMFSYQRHGVQTAVGSPAVLTLLHGLGYPPTFFLAKLTVVSGTSTVLDGKTVVSPLGLASVLAKNIGSILTIRGGQSPLSGDYLYVILKDPVDLAR